MHRFFAYWLLAFVLTLPSWWIVAVNQMADGRDLVWTAGFAASLATVLSLRKQPEATVPPRQPSSTTTGETKAELALFLD